MNNPIRTNVTEAHNSAGLFTGSYITGLAGFGTMMLLAPQSGKMTRAQIRQKALNCKIGLRTLSMTWWPCLILTIGKSWLKHVENKERYP